MNDEIEEGLSAQLDVIELLKWFRIFKFVSIISLRKNQAQMVKYFREYSLNADSDNKIEDSMGKTDLELEDLMRGFRPRDDHSDRIMLYMLTGRNLDNVMQDWLDPVDVEEDVRNSLSVNGNPDEPLL